jgi:hypothetical protein
MAIITKMIERKWVNTYQKYQWYRSNIVPLPCVIVIHAHTNFQEEIPRKGMEATRLVKILIDLYGNENHSRITRDIAICIAMDIIGEIRIDFGIEGMDDWAA